MAKKKTSVLWKLLGLALVTSFCGCAAAYHDYQGNCTPYRYSPPPLPPYVTYQNGHCPTPGASRYFHGRENTLEEEKNTLEDDTSPAREAR
ncbi:MAG: hypothetical protein ACQESR_04800 [Planctomycetota bacterium]